MRSLVGWILAIGLIAAPAIAAPGGSGDDNPPAETSHVGPEAKTAAKSAAAAPAKTDVSSIESELDGLRDLLQSQAKQIQEQSEQLKKQQQQMESLEKELKTSSASETAAAVPATGLPSGSSAASPGAASSVPSSSTPPPRKAGAQPEPSPLSFDIGSAKFTPVGFADFTNVFRTKTIGSGIGTTFAGVPYKVAGSFPNAGLTEDRFSEQNSRIGLRVDSHVAGGDVLGYLETDFLGNAASTINVTSNSDTLRMRLYFVDYKRGKWEFLGGQDWSMLTPNRRGIDPMPAGIFYTQDMDTNYQLGLVWERTPQFRIVFHPNQSVALGFSMENPQQYIGSGLITLPTVPASVSSNPAFLANQFDTNNNAVGGNTNTPNLLPDIVVKLAWDHEFANRHFHVEVAGVYRTFRVQNFTASTLAYYTNKTPGGGDSVNLNFDLFKNFTLVATSFWSDGGGRDIGTALAPDLIVRPPTVAGGAYTLSPVHSGSGIGGFEWQVIPQTMFYGYYGGVYVSKSFSTAPATICAGGFCGYGYPGSSTNDNRSLQEGTFGWIQTLWKNPNYGALSIITQASYLTRSAWAVPIGTPRSAQLAMGYVDLRYTLP